MNKLSGRSNPIICWKMNLIPVLLVSLLAQDVAASVDYMAASEDLDSITQDFTQSLFEDRGKSVYDAHLHSSVKSFLSLKQLEDIGEKYRKVLGKFISIKKTRLDFSITEKGLLAEAKYLGTFENANADIDVKALHLDGKWTFTMYAITSPLLNTESAYTRKSSEIYVVDSDAMATGETGKLIAKNNDGEEVVLITEVSVITVRWAASDEIRKSGFVTFDLSEEDEARVKQYPELSLRKSK
jgi:hypothetical protein